MSDPTAPVKDAVLEAELEPVPIPAEDVTAFHSHDSSGAMLGPLGEGE